MTTERTQPEAGNQPQYGRMRRVLTRVAGCVRRISAGAAAALVLAVLLRATVRDEWWISAPFFYALPLTVQVVAWFMLALVWRRRRWLRTWALGMSAGCFIWWTQALWKPLEIHKLRTSDRPVNVLFWNIGHTKRLPESLRTLILEREPEFIGLAESEELDRIAMAELQLAVPGYTVLQMPDGMIAMVRGTGKVLTSKWLKQSSRVHVVSAQLNSMPGLTWRFVLCDIGPFPPLPRTEILKEQLRQAGAEPRTLVVGDFNTPIDSAGFDAWHARFEHGIADCLDYSGPPETWCHGLPVLSIDHQWGSRDLIPAKAEKGSQVFMDHQWLLVHWLLMEPGP